MWSLDSYKNERQFYVPKGSNLMEDQDLFCKFVPQIVLQEIRSLIFHSCKFSRNNIVICREVIDTLTIVCNDNCQSKEALNKKAFSLLEDSVEMLGGGPSRKGTMTHFSDKHFLCKPNSQTGSIYFWMKITETALTTLILRSGVSWFMF